MITVRRENTSCDITSASSITRSRATSTTPLAIRPEAKAKGASSRATYAASVDPMNLPKTVTVTKDTIARTDRAVKEVSRFSPAEGEEKGNK